MTKQKISYDAQLMKVISLFETVTKTNLKDCFPSGETLYFVVEPENMGKAIGKQGKNAKLMERLLKKKIRILEFSPDLGTFIKNLLHPIIPKQIDIVDEKITITGQDIKTKAILIGRNSSNLNHYKEIINRYFEVKEIKVI
ncbi:NusA-like transcription termination signal-binding factor [Candidatus Woesearchaeota archaeon]|nr:NusA-like transcription termination signal-binding factor [Candidatus Woesearchaeota archaeon]